MACEVLGDTESVLWKQGGLQQPEKVQQGCRWLLGSDLLEMGRSRPLGGVRGGA
eukprot:CAMPEP_0206226102 /NCGR_PEP_ID=MMETSP0047_2-20121206/7893_1 /ASSEMBLY_ACC=CAM_ASM_000192 /TAXON_ID=195065 /ORGANISM="Chroomonas mesostigmatica_cf, Strain CCMP1168" /LENGTH=53 /DNA_ID=CAMNT_0053649129 /DNA_START=406 /DNA_END=565 /DNA_ORIENTATION=-